MATNQTAIDAKVMPMRRSLLITLTTLGSLVCLIGSTGLFAALSDTARTGTNQVDSAGLAASADIQLATASWQTSGFSCGSFSENLTTGFITAAAVAPPYSDYEYFCIKNVGSQTVSLAASVDELVDTETACTGDEAEHGDTTCGGSLAGELSSVLVVYYGAVDCTTAATDLSASGYLIDNVATAAAIPGTLGAGDIGCFVVNVDYFADGTGPDVQKAQSDQATWRFKFTATAVS